jgi:hypothetical protein
MRYPGGKNLAGVYQRIINLIPPHEVYVEPFCGSAAIYRHKRAAGRSILIDRDPGAIAALGERIRETRPQPELLLDDGIRWLTEHRTRLDGKCFVYCDPPYLPSSLRSRQRYLCGMDESDHRELLNVLRRLECGVMLSGYHSALYTEFLADWRTISFPVITRGGVMATECLWMNYPTPLELHDYRCLGRNFRERERFRRQQRRWARRLAAMDDLQRRALYSALADGGFGDRASTALQEASAPR